MRIRCKIYGCQIDGEDYYRSECWRCGAEMYDRDFIQQGILAQISSSRIMQFWWMIRYLVTNKCGNCGKRLWFQQYGFCNKKCEDEWIPF